MVKIKAKKQKLVKKSENIDNNKKIVKKLKTKKENKNKAEKPLTLVTIPEEIATDSTPDDSSDGEDSSEPESDQFQKLLEPYTKEQLIDFIIGAAIDDASLFNRIRDAADRDVSHRKIFVHGLGWNTTRETLTAAFEPFGEIEDCNVVTDRATGKAKGFGFVVFKSRQGSIKALKQPTKKINNRMASCQLASVGYVPSSSSDSSNRKIYVSNVQTDVDPERLRDFFSKFGEIEMGPIGFDMQTGKSRGFALFVYKRQEGFRKALEEPHKMFDGHQLQCQKAANGKNKGTSSSVITTAPTQPVPTPPMLAAAPNLTLFSQYPSLNPMYGALFATPNARFLPINPLLAAGGFGQVGTAGGTVANAGTGIGGYGGAPSQGLSMGGNQSVLGAYGSPTGPMLQGMGLQHVYPNSQVGPTLAARPQGASGSFSGYPSHL